MKAQKTTTTEYVWLEDNARINVSVQVEDGQPTYLCESHKDTNDTWVRTAFKYPEDAKLLAQTLMAAYRKWQNLTRVRSTPAPPTGEGGKK